MRSGGLQFEQVCILPDLHDFSKESQVPFHVSLASCGGPIATRSAHHLVKLFAGGGRFVASWQCPKPLFFMDFTEDLVLVLVCEDGSIYIWDHVSLSSPRLLIVLSKPPLLALTWHNGLVLLLSDYELVVYEKLRLQSNVFYRYAAKLPFLQPPACMCVLQPHNRLVHVEVAIALPDQPGILVVNKQGDVEARVPLNSRKPGALCSMGSSIQLIPHPTLNLVGCVDAQNAVHVLSTDFEHVLFSMQMDGKISQLCWCLGGAAGYALVMRNTPLQRSTASTATTVQVVGFFDHQSPSSSSSSCISYSFEGMMSCSLKMELDGVRVLVNNQSMHLIRRVSPLQQLSNHAETLLACVDEPAKLSALHDDINFEQACDELLDLVKFSFDQETKFRLFQACQLGRDYAKTAPFSLTTKFMQLTRFTRAFHSSLTGLSCATPLQCFQFGLQVVAARILLLGFDSEVAHFCSLLETPWRQRMEHPIAFHRAATSTSLSLPNEPASSELLCRTSALSVLQRNPALVLGEARLGHKIVALLHLKEFDRVVHLLSTSRGVDFDLLVRTSAFLAKHAFPLEKQVGVLEKAFRASLRSKRNPRALERWLMNLPPNKDVLVERGLLLCELALVENKFLLLEEALKSMDPASFYAKSTREYILLFALQRESKIPCGKSLAQTLVYCFSRNRLDLCELMKNKFQVKPLIMTRCRLQSFALRGLFLEAARIALQREELGWAVRDVVDLCFQFKADSAANRIANDLLPLNHNERASIFFRLRLYPEALAAAKESQNVDVLEDLKRMGGRNFDGIKVQAKEELERIQDRLLASSATTPSATNLAGRCQTQ